MSLSHLYHWLHLTLVFLWLFMTFVSVITLVSLITTVSLSLAPLFFLLTHCIYFSILTCFFVTLVSLTLLSLLSLVSLSVSSRLYVTLCHSRVTIFILFWLYFVSASVFFSLFVFLASSSFYHSRVSIFLTLVSVCFLCFSSVYDFCVNYIPL